MAQRKWSATVTVGPNTVSVESSDCDVLAEQERIALREADRLLRARTQPEALVSIYKQLARDSAPRLDRLWNVSYDPSRGRVRAYR